MVKKIDKKLLECSPFVICYICYLMTLCLMVFSFPAPVFAEEGAKAEAAEGGHGAPPAEGKAEGGEEKSEEGGEKAAAPTDEFLDLNIAIEQLNSKIRSKNEDLRKALVEKDKVKDPVEFKKIVEEIQKNYREIQEMTEELEKKKAVLRYRFPEKSFVKKSTKTETKDLEEVNAEAVLEEKTDELLEMVETQYQRPIRKKSTKRKISIHSRDPASDSQNADAEINNPEDFTKSLIIKK